MTAKVAFRGGWTCSCVATSLPFVELAMIKRGLIKSSIDIEQLGWRDDVNASKGTHLKGGCTDVLQRNHECIQCWRDWGWTMQDRSPWFPEMQHAHGWPYGCTHLSSDAQNQNTSWNNRRNGLVNNGVVQGK